MYLHDENATTHSDAISWKPVAARHHDIGIFDEKGRTVGIHATISEVVFAKREDGCGYRREPGLYFVAKVQATRDRFSYGASQPYHVFKTFDEADAHVWRSIEAAGKRYAKKYANNAKVVAL